MKAPKTNHYILGMQAINNFFVMLYQAMKVAMPTAIISQNGAYGWRGFQINQYKDLASNQFYCQIYPETPYHFPDKNNPIATFTSGELIFQESYLDSAHKPYPEFENIKFKKKGGYYNPFQVSLDLGKSRFFAMNRAEQFDLLKNFVAYASEQALIWQHSQARLKDTNKSFLKGNRNKNIKTIIPNQFDKVETEFLTVWGMQEELFKNLIKQLDPYKPATNETDWIRKNKSIYNFNFRGYRMKSGKLLPGKLDIRWQIFFNDPELLKCCTANKKLIGVYDLEKHGYFDLHADQQNIELTEFIKRCFDRF